MSYCSKCGCKLVNRLCDNDGMVDYCDVCDEFRFPTYNVAVSMIILNSQIEQALLIQQYGKPFNILVAGYVNKGENAEEALRRELMEEVNLVPLKIIYNKSSYFEQSNTLIINYVVIVENMNYKIAINEVDSAKWFKLDEINSVIKNPSLAKNFYNHFEENILKELKL